MVNEITDILETFSTKLFEDILESMEKKGITKSRGSASDLSSSLSFSFKNSQTGLSVEFSMFDYWKWVEEGRGPGGMPSVDRIEEWMKGKGIKPSKLKQATTGKRVKVSQSTYEKAHRSMAWAIAKNIAKKGTIKRFGYKGSKFLSDVLTDGRVDKLEETLTEVLGAKIEIELTNSLK
jgi:hypothetical protein